MISAAAKFAFVSVLVGSSLNYGTACPVGFSNVCKYDNLPGCVWADLVRFRSRTEGSKNTLSTLDITAMEPGQGNKVSPNKQCTDNDDSTKTESMDLVQGHPLCNWQYEAETDHLRAPVSVVKAVMNKEEKNKEYHLVHTGKHSQSRKTCQCSPITVKLPVSRFHTCNNGKEEWTVEKTTVTVGYTCIYVEP